MAAINWSNITDFGSVPGTANIASGGMFWVSTFYMLWIISILLLIGYGFEAAVVVGSFIMLIVGLLLVYAGLMAWQHLLTIIGVLLFMFLYIIWSSRKFRQ